MTITVDFTRPPTGKEVPKLEARLRRLDAPGASSRIDDIYGRMPGHLSPDGFVVRTGFSFRDHNIETDASDRRAVPNAMRPPATRLISSRSAALRFVVSLVALAQMNRKPATKARLSDLGISVVGSSGELGWSDLIAASATDSTRGAVFMTARDKRARSVRNALTTLETAGLVAIPGNAGERNRFDKFVLLNERGTDAVGEAEEYLVPRRPEATFTLPAGLISKGWLHVLEDSEIALLFMVACGKGGWVEDGLLVVPADVRLTQYGLHRDVYSSARKTLEWFGLLNVEEVGRHVDGRAENSDLRVHRLGLVTTGFDEPATSTAREVLRSQIARA